MKNRDTIILVVLAHIGLVLIWLTMGGCSFNTSQKKVDDVDVTEVEVPGDEELIIPDSDAGLIINDAPPVVTEEPVVTSPGLSSTGAIATANETEYVVKKGDSLWGISRKFNVSVNTLKARNKMTSDVIRIGDVLIVPSTNVAPVVEQPTVEPIAAPVESIAVPSAEMSEIPAADTSSMDTLAPVTTQPLYVEHVVQSGDSIWKLARQYKTTEAKIMEMNNITDPRKIQVGDKLKIPQQ